MSYDALLTETEFAAFRPNGEVLRYLELTRERLGLRREEMNVLDWGSGRGEYVAWLRDAGRRPNAVRRCSRRTATSMRA